MRILNNKEHEAFAQQNNEVEAVENGHYAPVASSALLHGSRDICKAIVKK